MWQNALLKAEKYHTGVQNCFKALFFFPVLKGHKTITFTIDSQNGTGTGELILFIETVDGIPVGKETLLNYHSEKERTSTRPLLYSLKLCQKKDCQLI